MTILFIFSILAAVIAPLMAIAVIGVFAIQQENPRRERQELGSTRPSIT